MNGRCSVGLLFMEGSLRIVCPRKKHHERRYRQTHQAPGLLWADRIKMLELALKTRIRVFSGKALHHPLRRAFRKSMTTPKTARTASRKRIHAAVTPTTGMMIESPSVDVRAPDAYSERTIASK